MQLERKIAHKTRRWFAICHRSLLSKRTTSHQALLITQLSRPQATMAGVEYRVWRSKQETLTSNWTHLCWRLVLYRLSTRQTILSYATRTRSRITRGPLLASTSRPQLKTRTPVNIISNAHLAHQAKRVKTKGLMSLPICNLKWTNKLLSMLKTKSGLWIESLIQTRVQIVWSLNAKDLLSRLAK